MTEKQFLDMLLRDIKIELDDEFDQNFERKAFFNHKWPVRKYPGSRGSLLATTGAYRRSIRSLIENGKIVYSSSLPYASIHNEGGEIKVTAKMKKFFWAMFFITSGKVPKRKDGKKSGSKAAQVLTTEAQFWRSMALMKAGSVIRIPERRSVGWHPEVDRAIERVSDSCVNELNENFNKQFKQ